jgi:predicted MFS family arabinose efflux permease
VEPALLSLAACGATLFALSDGLPGLSLGRAIIGAGVAACLMAPLKGLAMWYPPERQASLASWVMVAGGLGALAATAPLELALRHLSWREVFLGLAAATFAVAAWLWFVVPDTPKPVASSGAGAQWAGVRQVFSHPRFWWIAPLGGFGMGAFMAVQGLWAVPWMMEVEGLTRAGAASQLLAMSVVILGGYLLLGALSTALARRGVRSRDLFAIGFATNAAALVLITAGAPGSVVWWSLYGLGAATNILAFAVLNEGFPREVAGRANTALNLMMFVGSFVSQWGIGLVVDAARDFAGADTATGLRYAFVLVLLLDLATLAWFARGWRRFSKAAATGTAH